MLSEKVKRTDLVEKEQLLLVDEVLGLAAPKSALVAQRAEFDLALPILLGILAQNPSLCLAAQRVLIQRGPLECLGKLCRNMSLSPEVHLPLLQRSRDLGRELVRYHGHNLSEDAWVFLLKASKTDFDLRNALAEDAALDEGAQEEFFADEGLHNHLARNLSLTPELQSRFVEAYPGKATALVRLAQNSSITQETMLALAQHADETIRCALTSHPKLPQGIQDILAASTQRVRACLASAYPSHATQLVLVEDASLHSHLINNCEDDVLQRIVKDGNRDLWITLAGRSSLPAQVALLLAEKGDLDVLTILVSDAGRLSQETLEVLVQRGDTYVREYAYRAESFEWKPWMNAKDAHDFAIGFVESHMRTERVNPEVWEVLLENWEGSVQELAEASKLVSRFPGTP